MVTAGVSEGISYVFAGAAHTLLSSCRMFFPLETCATFFSLLIPAIAELLPF